MAWLVECVICGASYECLSMPLFRHWMCNIAGLNPTDVILSFKQVHFMLMFPVDSERQMHENFGVQEWKVHKMAHEVITVYAHWVLIEHIM